MRTFLAAALAVGLFAFAGCSCASNDCAPPPRVAVVAQPAPQVCPAPARVCVVKPYDAPIDLALPPSVYLPVQNVTYRDPMTNPTM